MRLGDLRRPKPSRCERQFREAFPNRTVRDVARQMALDTVLARRLDGPPFDPRMIAFQMGIPVTESHRIEAEAVLSGPLSAPSILIAALSPGDGRARRARQRFSV